MVEYNAEKETKNVNHLSAKDKRRENYFFNYVYALGVFTYIISLNPLVSSVSQVNIFILTSPTEKIAVHRG